MKVYIRGKEISINQVTWDQLCSWNCYVDHSKDRHIDWPARIKFKARCAQLEVEKDLQIGRFKPKSLWKRIFSFLK